MLRSCVQDEDKIQEITSRHASHVHVVLRAVNGWSTEVDGDFGGEARHGRSRNYEW